MQFIIGLIMAPNRENVLKTSADDLYELVKKRKKISVEEAAKILKLPVSTVQSLVDFLVEEKYFGLEYKFTTPFVYIAKEIEKIPIKEPKTESFVKKLVTKESFYEKAKHKDIQHQQIDDLWRKYLNQNLGNIKDEFYNKAKTRVINQIQIDELWRKYLSYLR